MTARYLLNDQKEIVRIPDRKERRLEWRNLRKQVGVQAGSRLEHTRAWRATWDSMRIRGDL